MHPNDVYVDVICLVQKLNLFFERYPQYWLFERPTTIFHPPREKTKKATPNFLIPNRVFLRVILTPPTQIYNVAGFFSRQIRGSRTG